MATRQELVDLVKNASEIGGENWIPLFMYALHKQFPEDAAGLMRLLKEDHHDSDQRQA